MNLMRGIDLKKIAASLTDASGAECKVWYILRNSWGIMIEEWGMITTLTNRLFVQKQVCLPFVRDVCMWHRKTSKWLQWRWWREMEMLTRLFVSCGSNVHSSCFTLFFKKQRKTKYNQQHKNYSTTQLSSFDFWFILRRGLFSIPSNESSTRFLNQDWRDLDREYNRSTNTWNFCIRITILLRRCLIVSSPKDIIPSKDRMSLVHFSLSMPQLYEYVEYKSRMGKARFFLSWRECSLEHTAFGSNSYL